jgi:hypothetical protein
MLPIGRPAFQSEKQNAHDGTKIQRFTERFHAIIRMSYNPLNRFFSNAPSSLVDLSAGGKSPLNRCLRNRATRDVLFWTREDAIALMVSSPLQFFHSGILVLLTLRYQFVGYVVLIDIADVLNGLSPNLS